MELLSDLTIKLTFGLLLGSHITLSGEFDFGIGSHGCKILQALLLRGSELHLASLLVLFESFLVWQLDFRRKFSSGDISQLRIYFFLRNLFASSAHYVAHQGCFNLILTIAHHAEACLAIVNGVGFRG